MGVLAERSGEFRAIMGSCVKTQAFLGGCHLASLHGCFSCIETLNISQSSPFHFYHELNSLLIPLTSLSFHLWRSRIKCKPFSNSICLCCCTTRGFPPHLESALSAGHAQPAPLITAHSLFRCIFVFPSEQRQQSCFWCASFRLVHSEHGINWWSFWSNMSTPTCEFYRPWSR